MTITKNNAATIANVIRTYENLSFKEEPRKYLDILDALAAGKAIQNAAGGGRWLDIESFCFNCKAEDYRVKPKLRHLTDKDLKVGDMFRQDVSERVVIFANGQVIECVLVNGAMKGSRHSWGICSSEISILRNGSWETETET